MNMNLSGVAFHKDFVQLIDGIIVDSSDQQINTSFFRHKKIWWNERLDIGVVPLVRFETKIGTIPVISVHTFTLHPQTKLQYHAERTHY